MAECKQFQYLITECCSMCTMLALKFSQSCFNPSFSKPFGTHTFYQGGVVSTPHFYLKNRCPHETEILQGIRDTFESLRNVKVVYIEFTCLP